MDAPFWEVEHTADWALHVRGRDLPELFTHAAQGMIALIADSEQLGEPDVSGEVVLAAADVETLLVDWLSELVYLYETEGVLYTVFEITEATPVSLRARMRGKKGERVKKEIKAVTYHGLQVRRTAEGFEATLVFDV